MATAELTTSRPVSRDAMRFSLWVAGCFVALAIACHALVGRGHIGAEAFAGGYPDTAVFAGVAAAFGCLTLLAHIPVIRSLAKQHAQPGSDRHPGGLIVNPVTALLLAMAIRLIGTFLVLAGLLVFQLVGQNEAVFDVLFWYVTLTTIEVVGIVWASKPSKSTSR